MKKLITLFLSVFLFLALAGFALTEAAEAPRTGWPERLSGLDGVTSVVELPANGKDPLYHTKLLVTFEQPLD